MRDELMSARDKLLAMSGVDLTHLNHASRKLIEDAADMLLAEHAKELAAKILDFKITPSGHPSYDDGKDAGLDLAASLIAPEEG